MPEATSPSSATFHPTQLAALALRTTGQLMDMHLAAARLMLQTQARAAAAFGLPDWSDWWASANERTRRLFDIGSDQFLATAQRASDAAGEMQREMGRLFDTQGAQAAEQWQQGLQQWGTQAQQGVDQLREAGRRAAEATQRRGEEIARQWQGSLLHSQDELREQAAQAGHELRRTVVQGAELAEATAAEATEATTALASAGSEVAQGAADAANAAAGRAKRAS